MAIKSSNQITFTEHKKIIEIKEWYLATSKDTDVTIESPGWTTNIQTIDYNNKYLWNYEEVIYSIGSSDISNPVIIGVYGESGASLQVKYISCTTMPIITNNDVSAWSDNIQAPKDGEKVYMTQKLSTDKNWSTPIQISATDGETPTMTIVDGYWYVNGESTGVKAEGQNGDTPEVIIGENGNWFINGVDTGIKAQGEAGKDGASIEYVYYRSKNEVVLSAPSYTNGVLTSGWTESPQGITSTYQYEYVSVRTKPTGSTWGEFSTPAIWSKWGEKGQDGDGVEYKYYLSNSSNTPTYSVEDDKWTDDPTGVSVTQQYEYVVQIKTSNGTSTISSPSLWAKFGDDGKGIVSITNYYATTTSADIAPSEWDVSVPELTATNKYMWNYESILYTDGTSTTTEAAIIGAYGDSGTDAVDFQIYSVDGFEFSETLTAIELKTVVFKAGSKIDSNSITYQWKWWNADSTLEDKYEVIPGEISSNLIVNKNTAYALTSIKCEITYDGMIYEDYISLTEKTSVYTAVAKFFNDSNIITSDKNYIVIYIELYKNNIAEELLYSGKIFMSDANSIQDGIISTNIEAKECVDGNMVYFVYKNMEPDVIEYNVVLGKYNDGKWNLVQSNYIYTNDLFASSTSPVVFIPKEKISRSLNINFEVHDDAAIVARTNTIVMDLNDPAISSMPPEDPKDGQLWLDTSVYPNILKMWNGSQWINSGYQNGNTIYTSKPIDGYSSGDLWILADGEVCRNFGPGSMLKSNVTSKSFNESHWVDAMEWNTDVLNNIKQYFLFNADTGLRIGQVDDHFYVNISSTKMSFYDNSEGKNKEVVYISNESANIDGLVVETSLDVNCNATFDAQVKFGKFVWKVESNGSLSLALET